MAFEFKLPDIGEGVAEGEIVKWFVAEGETVERDQPMVEVLTDKANVEIPAPRRGTILKILAREGETVPVHTTLVVIGEPGEAAGTAQPILRAVDGGKAAPEPAPADPGTQAASAPAAVKAGVREQPRAPSGPVRIIEPETEQEAQRQDASAPEPEGDGERGTRRLVASDRVLAMPGVRKFARDHGVDLARVRGTGSHGHILRADVERFLAESRTTAARAEAAAGSEALAGAEAMEAAPRPAFAAPTAPVRHRPAAEEPEEEIIPYRGVRRQIGKKMAQSAFTAPHYTYVEEVDAGALVELRRDSLEAAEERGVKLTYLPFIVKALVPCLKAFPLLNSVLDQEGQSIRLKKRYNIGIATASQEGLVVPVLKDADQLSVLEIAREIRRLSDAARDRSITIEELKGSTFTITSLGPLGGLLATPIINFPEVAILGVHAIKQRPVVKNGAVVPGHVMNLSLSFDHRVVDGAVGAEFTRMLVRYLENPARLLLES